MWPSSGGRRFISAPTSSPSSPLLPPMLRTCSPEISRGTRIYVRFLRMRHSKPQTIIKGTSTCTEYNNGLCYFLKHLAHSVFVFLVCSLPFISPFHASKLLVQFSKRIIFFRRKSFVAFWFINYDITAGGVFGVDITTRRGT